MLGEARVAALVLALLALMAGGFALEARKYRVLGLMLAGALAVGCAVAIVVDAFG